MASDKTTSKQRGGVPQNVKCPQCGTIAPYQGNPYRPFCSERCQIIDRGAWADGEYTLPSEDSAPLDDGEG